MRLAFCAGKVSDCAESSGGGGGEEGGGGRDRKWKREKLMDEGVGGASNSIRDTLETNFHSKVCSAFNEKKDRSGFRLG